MTAEVTRRLYGGRALTNHTGAEGEDVAGWPDVAQESIRAISYLTAAGPTPAPVVYDVLGNFQAAAHMLPQVLSQLGDGLARSLTEFDVYDHSGAAQDNVTTARAYLMEAAQKAAELGALLEAAQSVIEGQGYHGAGGAGE